MNWRHIPIAAGLSLVFAAAQMCADTVTLATVDKDPPAEFDSAIRGALQSKVIQLRNDGKTMIELWTVRELPIQSRPASPEKALDSLKQATLLGVVVIPASRRDYRDDEWPAGAYTLRLGLQPQDGNHLGTSDFSWFGVLVPAKGDTKPDGIKDYKTLVKASSQDTSTGHPIILSLRPITSIPATLPSLREPAPDHKSVTVKLPGKMTGGESGDIVFDLVYEGAVKK